MHEACSKNPLPLPPGPGCPYPRKGRGRVILFAPVVCGNWQLAKPKLLELVSSDRILRVSPRGEPGERNLITIQSQSLAGGEIRSFRPDLTQDW